MTARVQRDLEQAIDAGELVALAVVVEGDTLGAKMLIRTSGEMVGSLGDETLNERVATDAREMMARPRAETRTYEGTRVYIEVIPPPPHLIIFGGVHIAIPLADYAKTLGYRVTVADPRTKFANEERFPHVDAIIPKWPQKAVEEDLDVGPNTYCVILTHDPKIDEPALKSVLGKGARYVGAIGSRSTHAERFERMAKHGVSADQLHEVYAPIGLDLGAESPEEIALAIMAEIVAVRHGAPAGFMKEEET